jgi:hypothetical protein
MPVPVASSHPYDRWGGGDWDDRGVTAPSDALVGGSRWPPAVSVLLLVIDVVVRIRLPGDT